MDLFTLKLVQIKVGPLYYFTKNPWGTPNQPFIPPPPPTPQKRSLTPISTYGADMHVGHASHNIIT
jgi:hypothetical protein